MLRVGRLIDLIAHGYLESGMYYSICVANRRLEMEDTLEFIKSDKVELHILMDHQPVPFSKKNTRDTLNSSSAK